VEKDVLTPADTASAGFFSPRRRGDTGLAYPLRLKGIIEFQIAPLVVYRILTGLGIKAQGDALRFVTTQKVNVAVVDELAFGFRAIYRSRSA
jgi:hypothetical protein